MSLVCPVHSACAAAVPADEKGAAQHGPQLSRSADGGKRGVGDSRSFLREQLLA